MTEFWQPITKTPPYDTNLLLIREDGNVFQDVLYDISWAEYLDHWKNLSRAPIAGWAEIPPL